MAITMLICSPVHNLFKKKVLRHQRPAAHIVFGAQENQILH